MKKRLAALFLSFLLIVGSVAAETVTTPSDVETPVVVVTEAPATEVPVTEVPATEATVTEVPATETPATEATVTEVPVTEAPATEVPMTEAPATEAPATEAPATEAPVTEVPVTEVPVTAAPVTEAPVTEVPATETPATEAPVTEVPATEAPATEAPVTLVPATEAPATEAPVSEAPVTEVPATEVPATEAPATPEPFKTGLAKLASGASIHGSAKLADANPERTAGSGVVYATDISEDGGAIKIVYNNGSGIAAGWVKAGRVTMLSTGEVSSYCNASADACDYAGYKLDPIRMHVEVTEAPVTEAPVTEVPATEAPVTETSVAPAPLTEPTEGSYVIEKAHIREAADGLSPIMVTIPQYTVINAIAVEGDWVLASAEGYTGYIYIDCVKGIDHLLPVEEPTEVPNPETTPAPNMKVTIFTSRRCVMQPGETVTLTSKIEGFENYEIMYQWQWDRGNGFEDIPGANADFYAFESSIEMLSCDWRLIVYYR